MLFAGFHRIVNSRCLVLRGFDCAKNRPRCRRKANVSCTVTGRLARKLWRRSWCSTLFDTWQCPTLSASPTGDLLKQFDCSRQDQINPAAWRLSLSIPRDLAPHYTLPILPASRGFDLICVGFRNAKLAKLGPRPELSKHFLLIFWKQHRYRWRGKRSEERNDVRSRDTPVVLT